MSSVPRPAKWLTRCGFGSLSTLAPRFAGIAVLKVGPRTQPMAHAVVHALVKMLAPECLPVFTSDGLKLCFCALTAHFGSWAETVGKQTRQWQVHAQLLYGQVVKRYGRRRLIRVERHALLGSLDQLTTALRSSGESGTIQTAFVERLNLTVRQAVAALTRRTWGIAQASPELMLPLEWWRGYYHFTGRTPHSANHSPSPGSAAGNACPNAFAHEPSPKRSA